MTDDQDHRRPLAAPTDPPRRARARRVLRAAVAAELDEITEHQPLPRCDLRAIHAEAIAHGRITYQANP